MFQPRFRLHDRALMAMEASSAHTRPRLHHVMPGTIPAARERRDIGRDGAMLRHACRLAAGCRGASPPALSLGITEAQTASGLLARLIGEVLYDSGLPPERLELEFSEGSLQTDETELLYLLAALRDLGISLVLGGFGSGVSSLTLLRRRSLAGLLSGLRLDQLLVQDLGIDTRDAGFLHGLIASAHALGLLVMAEGIESERQCERLLSAGCDQGLGTWLGEPALPAVCMERALRAVSPGGYSRQPDPG